MGISQSLNVLHEEIKNYNSYAVFDVIKKLEKLKGKNEIYIPTNNEIKSIINGYFIVDEMLFKRKMFFVSKKQAIEFLKKDFIPKAIGTVYASITVSNGFNSKKDRQYFTDSMNAMDYIGFAMIINYSLHRNFNEFCSVGESFEKTFNDNLASELWFKVMYSIYSIFYILDVYVVTILIWIGVFFLGWRLLCN